MIKRREVSSDVRAEAVFLCITSKCCQSFGRVRGRAEDIDIGYYIGEGRVSSLDLTMVKSVRPT